jgi:hypothetical protein
MIWTYVPAFAFSYNGYIRFEISGVDVEKSRIFVMYLRILAYNRGLMDVLKAVVRLLRRGFVDVVSKQPRLSQDG